MTQVTQSPDPWDVGSAAYDEHIPYFLRWYVLECMRLAELSPSHEVLDVAAGPGLVALEVAPLVARVVAIDFAPKMIEVLAANVVRDGLHNVTAHVMDAQALALPDRSFDRVISNMGVMFFPDRVRGFSEMYRVLRPGGRAVVSVWSTIERFEAIAVLQAGVRRAVPDVPWPPQPPPVVALGDPAQLAAEMTAGGFADVRVETLTGYFESPSAESFWSRFLMSAPPMVAVLKSIGEENFERARANVIEDLQRRFGDSPVKLACEAHFAVGHRP